MSETNPPPEGRSAIDGMFQLGYLVDALEPAMAQWTRSFGVGPFFVLPPRVFPELRVDGQPTDRRDIIAGVALSYVGDTQIELIVPGEAPSTYSRFLEAGRSGLHHLGVASNDFDADRRLLLAQGGIVETEGRSALTRFAYIRGSVVHPGSIVELVEMGPRIVETFAMIKAATRHWDRRDPIRFL